MPYGEIGRGNSSPYADSMNSPKNTMRISKMLRIRFKRGTEAQNDSYTGALGSLSIDSDTNVVRIHDGTTVGGFKVGLGGSIDELLERVENLGIGDVDSLSTALSLKAAYDQIGVDDGIAGLNSSGLIPTEQLPSYVEDIVDVEDLESLPAEGESGKLYVIKSTNELYRWSASGQRWARITSAVDSSNDLSEGEVNLFLTDQRMREALSVEGDLSYDPATGLITLNASISSVNGQVGQAALDKADVGLDLVQDFTVATLQEAAEAQVDIRFTVPARIRTFAESMGFVDTESGWTAEPGPLPALELQGIWTRLADGPITSSSHSAVVLNGKMYVYDGFGSQSLWVYDPVSDNWTQLPAGPNTNGRHSAAVLNGKMYVHGGTGSGNILLNDLWVYNPTSNTWAELSPSADGRRYHSAVVIGDKMYVYGGYMGSASTRLEVYDPSTDTWTQLASGPERRQEHSAAVLNGKMYVYGGRGLGTTIQRTLFEYDPATNAWSQLSTGPSSRYNHTAVALHGKMYVYGGQVLSGRSPERTLFEYDPATNAWATLGNGPAARRNHTAVAINGKIYVYGGSDGNNNNAALYVLE